MGNPLSSHPFYRIMALMVIGYSVKVIDGVGVTEEEYEMARRATPEAAVAVSYGWLYDLRRYSAEELHRIISECKLAQKERKRKHQPKVSIVNALEGLLLPQTPDLLLGKANTGERIRKSDVIQRLTKRITELEKEVQHSRIKGRRTQSSQEKDMEVGMEANDGTLTPSQLVCISSFTFADNVFMQSNVKAEDLRRVCLQLRFEEIAHFRVLDS
ncbi:hypothetical protein STCU_10054 [Strigomonas culicis]|uniref:Uncharacterized protein n=1 Tax=Strigomonas culicis TaxID=28005 RepID=S9TPE4_9TRYP|nr:hypothetical protein STCU_10054 [Strigomonas culicis]|eukprot:EPY18328.1 hypothetical protein STCU_10054 [Strigomonas culicis]